MKYLASPSFWEAYEKLPDEIRDLADRSFDLLKANAQHPSLHLKKIGKFWSVRIGRKYRALAIEVEEGLLWFWIGTHAEYDKLIS
jgi:mRNA-degrading endonuclease RelE of RelBE toxin-antitoxin system